MDTFTIIGWILAVLGIIATCYFAKKQLKKPEITHFSINSYDVGKGLHDDFEGFKLTYEGAELQNEILVLKGGIVNTGGLDITGLKNNSDIRIILPDKCTLKKVKINKMSDELGVKVGEVNSAPNEIGFDIDEKFMNGEGFEYTALIETKEEIKYLHRKIKIKHRIPNVSDIRNEKIDVSQIRDDAYTKSDHFLLRFMRRDIVGIAALIAAAFTLPISLSTLFFQKVRCTFSEKGREEKMSLYITPSSQLCVSNNTSFPFFDHKKISREELEQNYNVTPDTDYSWKSEESMGAYGIAFVALLYLVMAILLLRRWNRDKRVYRLLEQYEEEQLIINVNEACHTTTAKTN